MIHFQRSHQTNLKVRPTTLSLWMEFRKLLPRDDPVAQVRRPQGEVIEDITVNPAVRAAFRSLDEVDVKHLFRDRAVIIKSLPFLIRGACKSAVRMALTGSRRPGFSKG